MDEQTKKTYWNETKPLNKWQRERLQKLRDYFEQNRKRIALDMGAFVVPTTKAAVKYYDKQKSKPEITIEIITTAKGVQFSIADNGLGIKSELKDKVFVMFFRASEKSYGSGLGLYIIKETVKKLNGTINMSSEEGKFTRFTVELPNLKQQVAV